MTALAIGRVATGTAFDSKNLLEIVFFFFLQAWGEESHFIGNDCGNERKWDEIEIRPGGGEDGRVTENPEIGGKKGEGEEVAKSEPL